MLESTTEECDEVKAYFLSQSPKATVTFAQKIYAETIVGHRHDVWDLHADDGRWWVVTNPTNLYSQEQFPSMDLVVTFHMGLCLRIPRAQKPSIDVSKLMPIASTFQQLEEVEASLNHADSLLGYRAVGVGCREALISFVQSLQDAGEWPNSDLKRSDVKGWSKQILGIILIGSENEKRRRLLRSSINEAWDFSNWLAHTSSATWHDAEVAHSSVSHAVNLQASLMLRYFRNVPDACPECGSAHISPQYAHREVDPEIKWERPACDDCSWTGKATPVGEHRENLLITREGEASDECSIMETPLTGLQRPNQS